MPGGGGEFDADFENIHQWKSLVDIQELLTLRLLAARPRIMSQRNVIFFNALPNLNYDPRDSKNAENTYQTMLPTLLDASDLYSLPERAIIFPPSYLISIGKQYNQIYPEPMMSEGGVKIYERPPLRGDLRGQISMIMDPNKVNLVIDLSLGKDTGMKGYRHDPAENIL
jgi:hypothetical protein